MFERSSTASTAGSGLDLRWLVGLLAAFAILLGGVSCSSDDGSDETGDSMELTPSSDDMDGSADAGGAGDSGGESPDSSDPDADDSEAEDRSDGSDSGPVAPVELTADEEAYRDDLLAAIDLEGADSGFDMECLAGRWIRSVGLERLNGDGVTPQAFAEEGPTAIDLSRDEALEFVRDYERCGMDLHDFILPADLDSGTRACITDSLDRGDLEDYIALAILGDDGGAAAMQDQVAASTAHCND